MRLAPTLSLVSALLLAACGSAEPAAKPAPSNSTPAGSGPAASSPAAAATQGNSGPASIVISYSELTPTNMALWGAKEAGIFEKNGLDVQLRLIESNLGVGALLSDNVQIGVMGGTEALSADVGGADLKVLATVSPVYPYTFEVASDIKTKDDLKGKKVGVSRIGSSSDTATRAGLRKIGIDPDKDVKIIQIGSLSARVSALMNGSIQGGVASLPDTLKLEAAGLHPLFDLAELKLPAAQNCMIARQSWLQDNRETAQKVVDSLIEGIIKVQQDKPFAEDVLRKYLKTGKDQKALDATYDYQAKRVYQRLPYPDKSQFKDAVEQLTAKNPAVQTFDLGTLLDRSFVQSAGERGIDKATA